MASLKIAKCSQTDENIIIAIGNFIINDETLATV